MRTRRLLDQLSTENIMKRTVARSLCLGLAALAGLALVWNATRPASPCRNAHVRNSCARSSTFRKTSSKDWRSRNLQRSRRAGKALKKLSEAAEWEVATIPNANDYVMLTTDFQRHADDLVKQAKAKNIDGATLAYVKLTMSCVQCHKFIRDTGK